MEDREMARAKWVVAIFLEKASILGKLWQISFCGLSHVETCKSMTLLGKED